VVHKELVYNATIEPEEKYVAPSQVAYAASSNPDIMYTCTKHYKNRIESSFLKQCKRKAQPIPKTETGSYLEGKVPTGEKILPPIWAMRRKHLINMQEVYKWKARLNIHGGKQVYRVHYWQTYASVATWSSIQMIMNLAALRAGRPGS
jgi:hypothetical protein